jgi:hypothetical protein
VSVNDVAGCPATVVRTEEAAFDLQDYRVDLDFRCFAALDAAECAAFGSAAVYAADAEDARCYLDFFGDDFALKPYSPRAASQGERAFHVLHVLLPS